MFNIMKLSGTGTLQLFYPGCAPQILQRKTGKVNKILTSYLLGNKNIHEEV